LDRGTADVCSAQDTIDLADAAFEETHLRSSAETKKFEMMPSTTAREGVMRNALQLLKRFGKDEEGAALVEYTVLLGVMLVAVIGTIVLVGGWVNTKWAALWTALSAN
jgi:pilus assembly protein Flp/PilA